MKFNKWIFYGLTVVIAIAGFAISASGDTIFAMPDDFHSTSEQRSQFIPSSWHFGGGFVTEWELTETDGYYVYFDATTTHSFSLNFRLEAASAGTINIVFTDISTDSIGYGFWDFNINVFNLETGATLATIISFSSEETVNVPDIEGYKFTLSGTFDYLACVSSIGDTCIVIDALTEHFSKIANLDLTEDVWETFKSGYENLSMTIANVVIFALFSVEYGINFKGREKKFRIVNAVSFATHGGIMIYSLIDVFKAISNKSIVGLTSPMTLLIVSIIAHLVVNIVESRLTKSVSAGQVYASPATSQPIYQTYTPQPTEQIAYQEDKQPSQQDTSSSSTVGTMKVCPSCGMDEQADAKFCTNCGSKLD